MSKLLPPHRQAGFIHVIPIAIVAVALVAVIGIAVYQVQSHKSDSQSPQTATNASPSPDARANTQSPAPTATPAATPTPTPKATATPAPTPKPANITHPTQASCNDQLFTVYASAVGGTKQYYNTDTSSQVYQTVPYGQSFTVKCGTWLKAGWALDGNNDVRFEDISTTKP